MCIAMEASNKVSIPRPLNEAKWEKKRLLDIP